MTDTEQIYKAWQAVGADLAGLKWDDFVAALAQPEQEPVAWAGVDFDIKTTPPQREPLTDEEICDLWSWSMTAEAERTANTQQHAFARAIEAKLKEKNNL